MIESVREDILKVLEGIDDALKRKEFEELKTVSNHTIHSASIFQDEDSISIAVITYALSKVMATCPPGLLDTMIKEVGLAHEALQRLEYENYKNSIKRLFKSISEINANLRQYIEEVIQYAEVKKGVKIYEHGISMARAAEILGISQWDLMEYVGKTTLIDSEEDDEKERLEFARRLFGLKR